MATSAENARVYSLVLLAALANGQLLDDPCDVEVSPAIERKGYIDRTVPPQCVQGEFRWAYPQNTVLLHFPNQEDVLRTVCVRNDILGDVFTVRDVTHMMGMPMVIGGEFFTHRNFRLIFYKINFKR
ncbi:hypothetical protein DPMN_173063 [Dreissena polymorpha]|uniref:Uncharacterized protein n=1 Tax=Dreissena polymorpha TaxID=45954 RepID=A0A9D4E4S0_DREPO|nr:hypothetical protein DPMN_173063 [Dreissena polymorpha]